MNAPIFKHEQLAAVARKAMARPRMDTADQLARRFGLTYADRSMLRISTIGACDLNKAARTRRRKERKRLRDRARPRERERRAVRSAGRNTWRGACHRPDRGRSKE